MLELLFVALLIMLGWGVGDFFLAKVARKENLFVLNFWKAIIPFVAVAILYFLLFFPKVIKGWDLALLVLYSVFAIAASLAFFKAFAIGKVSLMSPISSSYGVLAMVLSLAFLHEQLTSKQYLGIFVTTFGLFLSIIDFSALRAFRVKSGVKGLVYAFIYMLCWGANFTIAAVLVRRYDWVTPFFFNFMITIPVSFFIMLRLSNGRKPTSFFPAKSSFPLLILGTLFLEAAWLLYVYSVRSFPSALLAPISAAYPALTILLALFFFKERMTKIQYVGVGMILAGLVVAAL